MGKMAEEQLARLGLAWCKLNRFEWDEILGDKPKGFDELPNYMPPPFFPFLKRKPSKHDYVTPARDAIEDIIGPANVSRYWWTLALGRPESEWFTWYAGRGGPFSEEK